MYFKMALKNVRKSFKDYTIYFLTLTLAVCIFYSFNSMDSQNVMSLMESSGSAYGKSLITVISYVSVFVSVILGCLILYANNFLVKRRNKELAIYMTLGMSKFKISKILIYETLTAGVFSLGGGLLSGAIVSQGFSVFVLKLFKVNMDKFMFVFSPSAVIKTILYFSLMFLIVMIFNIFLIRRYKIIDLLYIGRKNEKAAFNKPLIYFITFILSIGTLGFAYNKALTTHLTFEDKTVLKIIILGVIGTILFFYSLSGIILYIVKKNKRLYLRNLNIFLVNQISSKVKTNFVSMAVISLMLFITIVALSIGISMKNAMEQDMKECTPYDASAHIRMSENKDYDIDDIMKSAGINKDLGEEYFFINRYADKISVRDYIDMNGSLNFIKQSEYNKGRKMRNEEELNLKDDEVYIFSSISEEARQIDDFIKKNNSMAIKDKEYKIKNDKVTKENITTDVLQDNCFTVVINDEFCDGLKNIECDINIKYPEDNKEECEMKYADLYEKYTYGEEEAKSPLKVCTRESQYNRNIKITGIMLLVLIYLGLVFLITSMAVLAIHVLCETNDSFERYITLKKLGVNEKSINKTIFNQVLIYFSLPVIVASVHSIVGIKVSASSALIYDNTDMLTSAFITMIILLSIYVLYFIAAFTGCKNIVKSKM